MDPFKDFNVPDTYMLCCHRLQSTEYCAFCRRRNENFALPGVDNPTRVVGPTITAQQQPVPTAHSSTTSGSIESRLADLERQIQCLPELQHQARRVPELENRIRQLEARMPVGNPLGPIPIRSHAAVAATAADVVKAPSAASSSAAPTIRPKLPVQVSTNTHSITQVPKKSSSIMASFLAEQQQKDVAQSKSGTGTPFSLRPKVFEGLTCTVCAQTNHPHGSCQKPVLDRYWEVLVAVSSNPDEKDRCTKCIAAKKDGAAHTTAEHGITKWYDHPDNPMLPDNLVRFYRPVPGLERNGRRTDIPPLPILHARESERDHKGVAAYFERKQKKQERAEDITWLSSRQHKYKLQHDVISGAALTVHRGSNVAGINLAATPQQRQAPLKNSKKRVKGVPDSGWQKEGTALPSIDYLDFMWKVLSRSETAKIQTLFDKWHVASDTKAYGGIQEGFKEMELQKLAGDVMQICLPKEEEAAILHHALHGRREGLPEPRTDRSHLRRKVYHLDPCPFLVKSTKGFPKKTESVSRQAMLENPHLKISNPKNSDAGASSDSEPRQILAGEKRSLQFHIQDYPITKAQCIEHLAKWSNAMLESMDKYDLRTKFVAWFQEKHTAAGNKLLQNYPPAGSVFKDASKALQSAREGAIATVTATIQEIIRVAEREKSACNSGANAQMSFIEFDEKVSYLRTLFSCYNGDIDICLKMMEEEPTIAKELDPKSSKCWRERKDLLGDIYPAESDVETVIPWWTWPEEAISDLSPVKDWAEDEP